MKNIKISGKLLVLISFTFPFLALAQGNIQTLIGVIADIVRLLIPIVVALALLYFFWGLAQFILKSGEGEAAVEEGKKKMIWGIVALFVMVSIWGIITLISSTFLEGLEGSVFHAFPI